MLIPGKTGGKKQEANQVTWKWESELSSKSSRQWEDYRPSLWEVKEQVRYYKSYGLWKCIFFLLLWVQDML
jgi:hypothetical protein